MQAGKVAEHLLTAGFQKKMCEIDFVPKAYTYKSSVFSEISPQPYFFLLQLFFIERPSDYQNLEKKIISLILNGIILHSKNVQNLVIFLKY